uniref:Uncharacterized protein n=1 Tax=Solanum tuberosum TaxID=4113 RepID=M0ZR10_SOLTU
MNYCIPNFFHESLSWAKSRVVLLQTEETCARHRQNHRVFFLVTSLLCKSNSKPE